MSWRGLISVLNMLPGSAWFSDVLALKDEEKATMLAS